MKSWPRSFSTALTNGRVRESFRDSVGRCGVFSRCLLLVSGLSDQQARKPGDGHSSGWRNERDSSLTASGGNKMKKLIYGLMVGLLFLSLGSGRAAGQATASAALQGTVTDQSGAVVAG